MNYIKGKIRNIIYNNKENGYAVAVFRIKETNDPKMDEYVNKTVRKINLALAVEKDILPQ